MRSANGVPGDDKGLSEKMDSDEREKTMVALKGDSDEAHGLLQKSIRTGVRILPRLPPGPCALRLKELLNYVLKSRGTASCEDPGVLTACLQRILEEAISSLEND